jgi:hypothetical protein
MFFPTSMSRRALWLLPAALAIVFSACSNVTEVYRSIDLDVAQGKYLPAIHTIQANAAVYGEKSRVLYNLDIGLLYHYAGMPDSSDAYLFAAEREIGELYTKSISLAAISMLTNDNVLPYEGEDHEKVLVNLFLAMNYARQGNDEDALVEARKVDLKLREYSRQYEGKNKYQEDALIRYIAGALYENDDQTNDAFISYRKAYDAYLKYETDYHTPIPPCLLDDLVRTGRVMGFDDQVESFEQRGGTVPRGEDPGRGSIFVIAYAGRGPVKEENRTTVSIPDSAGTVHTFQLALPRFVPRFRGPRAYHVRVEGAGDSLITWEDRTVIAEDVTQIAEKCLEDRLGLIYLKSGGRAVLKMLAAEQAKKGLRKKDDNVLNFLGSLAVDLVVGITEQADVRMWGTLPAQIQVARIWLPPGRYTTYIEAADGGYSVGPDTLLVRKGRTEFVFVDDIR